MNYWIFKSRDCDASDGTKYRAIEAYRLRMKFRLWGLNIEKENGAKMPHVLNLTPGDKVVFYLTGEQKSFVGTATILCTKLSEEDRTTLSRESVFLDADCGVRLADTVEWEYPMPAKKLVPSLKFIKDESHWGQYLQGQITRLAHVEDFELINGEAGESL